MTDPLPFKRPIRWASLRADEAERVIREWSRDTGRVVITGHALDRVGERAIGTPEVYRILQAGHCVSDPVRNERGHWQAEMTARLPGGRQAAAVTVILRDDRKLIVRTVMWKDLRS